MSNHIVLDLGKVQYASFYYRNQFGQVRRTKPKYSVNGVRFKPSDIAHTVGEPMSLLELAKVNDVLDRWTPVIRFQLTANHTLKYTGKKAIAMWKAWRGKVFKK